MKKRVTVLVASAFACIQPALGHGPIFERGLLEIADDRDGEGKGGLINLGLLEEKDKAGKVEHPDSLIEVGNDSGNEQAGLIQIGNLVIGGSSGLGGLPLLGAAGGGNILQGITGSGLPLPGAGGGSVLQGVTGGSNQTSTTQTASTTQGSNLAQGLPLLGP